MTSIPTGAVAERWRRLAGSFIDGLVVSGPYLVLVVATSEMDLERGVSDRPAWVTVAGTVMWMLYEVLLTARDGQTLGKKVMRTRVVTADTQVVPGLGAAFVRVLPHLLSLVPMLRLASVLIYAPVAWRRDRRGVHDFLARTVVVSSDY